MPSSQRSNIDPFAHRVAVALLDNVAKMNTDTPLPALARATHALEPMAGLLTAALWAKTASAASARSAGHVGLRPVDRSRAPIGAANTLSTAESHRIGR
jgi:hypothetical protein